MELLILLLLLLGPCASNDGEALFCEGAGCDALADAAGEGGGGGAGSGGADHGGEGGAGGEELPPPCECDDGNPCNGLETCAADGTCVTTGEPAPMDDRNACTDDYCEGGLPVHQEQPVDDGDPCTKDYCDPSLGVIHSPLAACMG